MTNRNLGRFKIGLSLLQKDPGRFAEVFAFLKLLPVQVDYGYGDDSLYYLAVCDRFELIPLGMQVPWYDLIVHTDESGAVTGVNVGPGLYFDDPRR